MAEREDPDLVILDMMMPKRSGFLVLEKLRRTRPVPVRIIMVTANEGSRHKAYAETLGVDDYIRKPFAMDRLLEQRRKTAGDGKRGKFRDYCRMAVVFCRVRETHHPLWAVVRFTHPTNGGSNNAI